MNTSDESQAIESLRAYHDDLNHERLKTKEFSHVHYFSSES